MPDVTSARRHPEPCPSVCSAHAPPPLAPLPSHAFPRCFSGVGRTIRAGSEGGSNNDALSLSPFFCAEHSLKPSTAPFTISDDGCSPTKRRWRGLIFLPSPPRKAELSSFQHGGGGRELHVRGVRPVFSPLALRASRHGEQRGGGRRESCGTPASHPPPRDGRGTLRGGGAGGRHPLPWVVGLGDLLRSLAAFISKYQIKRIFSPPSPRHNSGASSLTGEKLVSWDEAPRPVPTPLF